jgi:UDP-glucuronate decarboxylase
MKYYKKKILVTGGAGFLGSHLCNRLIKEGVHVTCVDNLYTGSINNILHLTKLDNFNFINHDISFPLELEIDEIYNLACPASPVHYQKNPIKTIKTSVLGALNMLELASQNNATIFQASTSEVYGDPLVHPQAEDYWGNVNPIGVRSCYDEGKRCAETLFFDYLREHKLIIKVGRIFNTYGPNMHPDDGRVVSNFIVQALQNKPLTIYGDGSQTRSFCYVDDLIESFIRFMASDDKITGPLNLGNPIEFSINELAESVLKLTNSNSKLNYLELPSDDPRQRKPDLSKTSDLLSWFPETQLNEGLKKTVPFFEKLLNQSKN